MDITLTWNVYKMSNNEAKTNHEASANSTRSEVVVLVKVVGVTAGMLLLGGTLAEDHSPYSVHHTHAVEHVVDGDEAEEQGHADQEVHCSAVETSEFSTAADGKQSTTCMRFHESVHK